MFARIRNSLRGLLGWVMDLFDVLSPARYSVLILLAGTLAFLLVPQGQDVLRRMAEWDAGSTFELVRVLGRLTLFVASVLVWAASTWYWARVILSLPEPGSAPTTPRKDRMREWLPRILGFLAVLGMSVALWVAANNYLQFTSADDRLIGRGPILRLRVLSATLFVLAWGFLVLLSRRRDMIRATRARLGKRLEAPPHAAAQFADAGALPTGTKRAVRASILVSLVLGLLFAFWPVPVGTMLGTLPVILLTAANGVLLGTGLLYASRLSRLPLLFVLLVLAMIFSRWNDNHAMRLAEQGSEPTAPTIAEHFQVWQGNAPGKPIFIVASEGGGIRAAYWTAIVLGELERQWPGFSRQVFAISGVSGGSLGGAVFTALAAERESGSLRCGDLRACARRVLGHDFLSPTVARMVAPDLVQRFLPVPLPFTDRAQALEDSWAAAWEEEIGTARFDRPFQELWKDDRLTVVPSLVLNGTHVESGRRIVTTNLRWDAGELRDTYDLLRVVKADLPLKTAVHNSARFTYISPAGTMRPLGAPRWLWWGHDRGHVVDGGYFENSGTATALELVAAVQQACNHACDGRISILYLRNSPETDPSLRPDPGNPDNTLNRELGEDGKLSIQSVASVKNLEPFSKSYPRLNELLSPPRALLNTRAARGSLSVKSAQAALSPPGQPSRFFEIGLCESVEDPKRPGKLARAPLPLGWQLSETARQAMEDQLRRGFKDGCRRSDNWKTMQAIGRLLRGSS